MDATDERPDPEALLRRIDAQASRAGRGRLRIWFGSSAGVGKTCAMLLAARKRREEGLDVLAGVVETHGRSETAALLAGLPLLAPASVLHRGRRLDEFDLDGALARAPALILVDELAHANAPGSRHAKRWQDVEELLAAGIDVYGTLNVQHLESLNDVVGGITGVRVQETVPDTFFDAADEVVMVDTPADELLARLAAGKVYLPAQAERAAKNFFRKGNLMALRELALRRTADRVEGDVQAWRSERRVRQVWKTEAAILCAIGPRPGAEQVVRSAARLAQQLGVAWHAVYVETPTLQTLPDARREAILRCVRLAQDLGATGAVLSAQDAAAALRAHAREHNLSKLVLGRSPPAGWRAWLRPPGLRQRFAEGAPDIDLIEVGGGEPQAETGSAAAPRAGSSADESAETSPQRWPPYLWALAACAATTLLTLPLQRWFDVPNIVMLYLLTVVLVALRFGRGPSVLAAFVSVASFDFVHVPPRGSFAVSDVQYLLTFAVMLAVGLITGQLTAGLRFQARVAAHREARLRSLFELARELSAALLVDQVVQAARASIGREFHGRVRVFVLGADDQLQPAETPPEDTAAGPEADLGTARWALDHGQPAGLGTDTLAGSPWLYLPLKAPMRSRGVLALQARSRRLLMVPEQRAQLETFAALVATALERVHYLEVAQSASMQIESERLRNSLLAALSHDLRTPLAALYGLADSLVAAGDSLPAEPRETALAIRLEARRINAMVGNLLDMARLQSGAVQLRRQWQPIEEVVGAALQGLRGVLQGHTVRTELASTLPLVNIDAALLERVFANLLENAAKYTPPGSTVTISASVQGENLQVTVADDGPGLPPGREEALFEKFVRGQAESAMPGVGLGLAICRAIVEAHGGRIGAEPSVGGGGAVFRFTLPLGTPPAPPEDEETP